MTGDRVLWSSLAERVLPDLDHDHQWRYTERGRALHAVHGDGTARCGGADVRDPGEWLGGGSQAEHERLMLLPLCRRCRRILGIG